MVFFYMYLSNFTEYMRETEGGRKRENDKKIIWYSNKKSLRKINFTSKINSYYFFTVQ